ncbi:putative enoyl hydratase isomerase family protein [Phaeomoniella chlamydospora]|uniref:Putative enoyl hydratase isomerase family protein n=1 Tax=Phaeomoniella chlamydospora TaxID=158046 RepID=A0A0G2EY08_PHACM|nr:putative enoyl hydratase isomerase family protein [Phaeomoniella chlamydospora]
MAPIPPLFVVQIPLSPPTANVQVKGSFICTSPSPKVYLLTFSSPPDNRLTPDFNEAFLLALDIIEARFPKGVVITTSSIEKFYSNGLDYESAIKDPKFWSRSIYPLWKRLLTFPMPTVALINGHAFAGGLMTAMMHDYRIMNPHKGFVCLNELDFGAPLRPAMASIFKVKIPNMTTIRGMVLESRRYPALQALKEGIIDGVGGGNEALSFINEMQLVQKAQSKSYGLLKEELYKSAVKDLEETLESFMAEGSKVEERSKEVQGRRKRVDDWEKMTGRQVSKL